MDRSELEQEVFNIESGSMDDTRSDEEIWSQIKSASSEELQFYLLEYREHLRFVSVVESLSLKDDNFIF